MFDAAIDDGSTGRKMDTGSHRKLGAIRAVMRLFAVVAALLLVAGFVGQFLPVRRYPWVLDVWRYTWPVSYIIGRYLPTVYRGIDVSLLIGLALLWGLIALASWGLDIAESRLHRRRVAARMTPAPERVSEGGQPATQRAPAPPSHSASSYRPEAVVVIDLVKSSVLASQFGSTFLFGLKERLREQLVQTSSKHGLAFSKGTGDGFLLAFPSVGKATEALRELFLGLPAINLNLPEGAEIALRASMNFGEVLLEVDGDRIGTVVHKAFRLEGLHAPNLIESEGGIRRDQFPEKNYILVSEEAMSALPEAQRGRCQLLGLCELKGFPGFHRVYQLQWEAQG
jgi:class 3 adenylate cyclase